MRPVLLAGRLFAVLLLVSAGCQSGPYGTKAQVEKLQADHAAVVQQNRQLEQTSARFERENQEYVKLLAQSQQQLQQRNEEFAALREQMTDTTQQLARLREEKDDVQRKAEDLLASTRRRGGAIITANNSLNDNLPARNIRGVYVRLDGDLIRIELPADTLFQSGTAQLRPGAAALIDSVAAEIALDYRDHFIGIEGHSDSDVRLSTQSPAVHQLSVSRAGAVFNRLVAHRRFQARQLFIVGHGPNHPRFSNGDDAGKARNRRVELVIYPDKLPVRS